MGAQHPLMQMRMQLFNGCIGSSNYEFSCVHNEAAVELFEYVSLSYNMQPILHNL